jgi:UDP-glucose 4-epimerase
VLAGLPPVIYGDGKQTRDYMYIKDTVNAYKLILKSYEKVLGKAINFGTGKEVAIIDLANMLLELGGNNSTPVHVAPRAGEVTRLCADMSLAEKTLGFTPAYTIQKGLQEFLNWYKEGRYEEWIAYTSNEET